MIEEAICGALEANQAVASLIADRLTEMPLPQGSALPAITYQIISGPNFGALELDGKPGNDLPVWVRIQIDCWAATSLEAANLAKAVLDLLQGFCGVVAGIGVMDTVLLPGGAGRDFEADVPRPDGGTGIRRVSMDFRVQCRKGDA